MKKQLLAFITCFTIALMANAQSKTATLFAGDGNVIQSVTNRGDSGFIISTGNAKFRGDVKITYYDQNLQKNWEYDVKQGDVLGGSFFCSQRIHRIYLLDEFNHKRNRPKCG